MATNPIGKGTQNFTINMPKPLKKALQELADRSGMSLGEYIRTVLEDAKKEQVRFQTKVEKMK